MVPNSAAISPSETPTTDRLRCILQDAKESRTQTGILLVGPSGAGKSALARTVLRSVGFQIHTLDFRQLCHDDSTASIAAIAAAFQPTEDGKAKAVVLDDLDFWAPAPGSSNSVSSIDTRIIAALSDALATVSESSQPFAFIATACDESAVHSALRYPGRLERVLPLFPLSVEQRTSLAEAWLHHAFNKGLACDQGDFYQAASHIANVTPGFVHSDLRRLFAALEEQTVVRCDSIRAFPAGPGELLSQPHFWDTIKSVTPSLLTAATGSSPVRRQGVTVVTADSLHGLDEAIQRFRECLAAVFSSTTRHPANIDPHITSTTRALQTLGTFRGLILYGPTGCGKTAITRLAPSLLPRNTVNFLNADATSIVSSVVGEAERKLAQLFSIASAIAPALLVVENIDVLAPCRDVAAGDGGSAAEAFNRLLSTFLTQIDGIHGRNENAPVFIIATTRSLELIDPALLRPGRFEMHIEVNPPDALARVRILESFLESRNLKLREGLGKTILFNFDKFKADSQGWTAPEVLAFGRELLIDEKIADRHQHFA